MEEEKKNKINLQVISSLLMVIAFAIIAYAIFFYNNRSDEEPKKIYKPNDVQINDFSFSFLKLETNNENIVYSPLSIKYALSMLRDGAEGITRDEIVNVIKDDNVTKYENVKDVLSVANSMFIRDTYKEYVKDEYINNLKDNYNAEVIYDSFKNADNVNNWILEKTFKIIKDMLKDSDVQNPNLEAILVNALAIDMDWLEKFDEKDTHERTFYKSDNEELKAAMMFKSTRSNYYKYYQDEEYNVLSMPLKEYEGNNLEFIAIMPKNEDLHKFATSSTFEEKVNELLSNMKNPTDVELSISIPRFEFEYNLNLKDDLMNLGIKAAFSNLDADFSNMSKRELVVGDALHKANIKFSEKGVKAGAATVILMLDKSSAIEEGKIVYLNYDRPFMFIVRDSNTNEIWFVGNVYNPILWKDVKEDYKYR